ncbi:MAG: phenylalanine--tRNA ligase subunit alpha [Chloroflexi bacterium]|nr:phenylalanine--tRNA ligase subunit alpha [Chloroflexota bacterium]
MSPLDELQSKALAELAAIADLKELEAWRVFYLGKKSQLTQTLRGLASLSVDDRRQAGAQANQLKLLLESSFEEKKKTLQQAQLAAARQEYFDVTLAGRPLTLGRLHPVTQTIREIGAIFSGLGFQVVEGPEVEWDRYNFEALNIPPGHPARDMWSTFWMDYKTESGQTPMLLRTHTSPMQPRVMEKTKPPVRVVVPGKVYRYEATDATHESQFHQVEGLAVDEGITLADLKGTLYEFARRFFGSDRKARFRCDYFPFVEPGVEMAIDCWVCKGAGCRLCGNSGWIEILGAGMVHPHVLERVGYDSNKYTGFAFGMGVERMPMLKYGIDDIRHFFANDLRFLRQF